MTDVLLSHDHPDHIGSLPDVRIHAPQAIVWGNAPVAGRTLDEGDIVRGLTVLATPGHTAGHVSLLHESGALLVGDLVGNQGGALSRPPAPFTADADEASGRWAESHQSPSIDCSPPTVPNFQIRPDSSTVSCADRERDDLRHCHHQPPSSASAS